MELHGAELVVSSPGNYAFERVKDRFINAREITIITYNICPYAETADFSDNTIHALMRLKN